MKPRKKDIGPLKNILRKELFLSERARIHFDLRISSEYPVGSDIVIEDGKRRIFVKLSHTASWDELSHLLLIRGLDEDSGEVKLAARLIPDSIRRAADRLNIATIQLPDDLIIKKKDLRPRGKITSEKAWKIILYLLKSGPCSIRSISQSENISYGWTHGVITNLISRNIVDRKSNLVEIADIDALMNAVAWERPLKEEEEFEVTTSFDSTSDLSRTLTSWSERRGSPLVLCAYTAATLHFGLGIRSDLVHCYIEDRRTREVVRREFSSEQEKGIKLKVLKPDRDVYDGSTVVDSTRITSKEQTVLDIAGLGYSGRDLLDELVKNYGTDSP
ncbi:MAG: hypothetical protein U9R75_00600 [Candidatus Thermoplasmatota archaeon]|nr:hypothetical protein [Candidatus Thermoplasmatota archaeon]